MSSSKIPCPTCCGTGRLMSPCGDKCFHCKGRRVVWDNSELVKFLEAIKTEAFGIWFELKAHDEVHRFYNNICSWVVRARRGDEMDDRITKERANGTLQQLKFVANKIEESDG